MKKLILAMTLFCALLLPCFSQEEKEAYRYLENKISMAEPIELNIDLLWLCKPWIDNKLVTIDHKNRFATIEFLVDKNGKDYAKMSPLCNYPKCSPTNNFWVFPESQTVCVWSSLMMHIFNNKTKKKNSFIPLKSWKGYFDSAFELSPNDLYMHFYYWDVEDNARHIYWTYNQKKKLINYDDIIARISEKLLFQLEPYGKKFLAYETDYKKNTCKYFYYNIENEERWSNDFTEKLTEVFPEAFSEIFINKEKRFLISLIYRNQNGLLKRNYALMTWSEDKNDFGIFPLDAIVPKGKKMKTLESISDDRRWGVFWLEGYKGINNEVLFKYAFVNFDSKYPMNFSPLVIIDDYYGRYKYWKYSSFFIHPIYGQCFMYTMLDKETKKNKAYFYKMSDVQKEIDRILLEKAKSTLSEGK